MALDHPAWVEYQRRRFMRPDAERCIRPDAQRFFRPGAFESFIAQHLERKYDGQPRVPAGNPGGGRWTDEGGAPSFRPTLAGLSKISGKRPPSAPERNKYIKAAAIALAEMGAAAVDHIAKTSWLYEALPYINAYLDGPKSLGELRELAQSPERGYDIHHIVEQTSAERDG